MRPLVPIAVSQRILFAAALTAGLLLAPGGAQAQTIVHTDPADIILSGTSPNGGDVFEIHLNNDGVSDLSVGVQVVRNSDDISFGFAGRPLTSRFVSPVIGTPAALTPGETIGPTSTFDDPATGSAILGSIIDGTPEGFWPQSQDRFLGVEFKIGSAVHYGWVRMNLYTSLDLAVLVVRDWAYNATPGEAILAGQTEGAPAPSAVPEPSSLALFAAGGAASLGLLRRRRTSA